VWGGWDRRHCHWRCVTESNCNFQQLHESCNIRNLCNSALNRQPGNNRIQAREILKLDVFLPLLFIFLAWLLSTLPWSTQGLIYHLLKHYCNKQKMLHTRFHFSGIFWVREQWGASRFSSLSSLFSNDRTASAAPAAREQPSASASAANTNTLPCVQALEDSENNNCISTSQCFEPSFF